MKIVQINVVSGQGSTGKICVHISKKLTEQPIENYVLYCSGNDEYPLAIYYGDISTKISALFSRILGNYGFNSYRVTQKIIRVLDDIKPDIVHLHNMHGHNCNMKILFDYFRRNKIKIVWTFHDCWAFTAYCPCFDMVRCDKWKSECKNCVQAKKFSWFLDRSKWLYYKKKQSFSGLKMTIITPSMWMADRVGESFLREYPLKVINNGIDLSIFKPTDLEFKEKYAGLQNKYVVLGVAQEWVLRKGPDIFIELSKRLDYEKYQIVLVGKNEKIDIKENSQIIWISQTSNQQELASIYSVADVYVNPTREDTYPTVNMEALACGTPVVTFRTGGSPEMLNEKVGFVVERDDIDALEREIIRICEEKPYSREDCVEHAKNFDMNARYMEYVELYKELL